VIDGALNLI